MAQLPQPLPATALNAHSLHGHLDGVHHGLGWHDEAGDDDVIHAPSIIVERFLSRVKSEAEIAIAKVFGLGKSSAKDIRHNGRFYKRMLHFPSPCSSRGCSSALGHDGTFCAASTSAHLEEITPTYARASHPVNGSNVSVNGSRHAFISPSNDSWRGKI